MKNQREYMLGGMVDAQVAQSAEHVLGKDEVGGSIPLLGLYIAVMLDHYEEQPPCNRSLSPEGA